MKKNIKKSLPLYFLLLPAILYLLVFNYVPMYGVQIAFRDFSVKRGIWGSEWIGLENFIKFVTFPNFKKIFINTAVLGGYSLATFPCALIFALMLNEVKNVKFKKTVQMISYMPHFLSWVIIYGLALQLFAPTNGLVNMDFLNKMKKSAILINTSRGAVINEADLKTALDEGYKMAEGRTKGCLISLEQHKSLILCQ